jgi:hypothetical protein
MTRIIQADMAEPTGLECDECQHREMDDHGRLGAIFARGAWAQSMSSSEDHLCGECYRTLEPIARENYWRRQPISINGHPWPEQA